MMIIELIMREVDDTEPNETNDEEFINIPSILCSVQVKIMRGMARHTGDIDNDCDYRL